MNRLVLLSGGLDSAVLAYDLAQENLTHALAFKYRQKHSIETFYSRQLALKLKVKDWRLMDIGCVFETFNSTLLWGGEAVPHISYDDLKKQQGPAATVVPMRNAIFLSLAAGYAQSNDISLVSYAAHATDARGYAYPDCTPDFGYWMGQVIHTSTYGTVGLHAPFMDKTKAEVVALGAKLGVPFELTWSCYDPQVKAEKNGYALEWRDYIHCGECSTCLERQAAFNEAGVADPTTYKINEIGVS